MRINTLPVLLALTLAATGCARMKVTSEQVQDIDFSTFHTYQWIDGPEEILNETDTYILDDLKTALDEALIARGGQPIEADGHADFQVAYYIKLREQMEYTTPASRDERDFSGGFVYNKDKQGWDYSEREPDINVYMVEIGTLTLLLYDADTGELVWRGNLQTEIDRSLPKEQREERYRKAAEKLTGHIPM